MRPSRFVVVLGTAGCAAFLTACANTAPAASDSPGSSAAASPSAASTGTASLAACTAPQLAITLTRTGALGGQAGGYLAFTNKGAGSCQITGWPSVTGVSKSGASAALAHAHSTMFGAWQYSSPAPVITLAPGASAYAVVAADDNPAGSAASCPAPYAELRVAAPGSTSATTVSAWLPGADSYLPTCASAAGKATDETSDIVPLSSLPH
ncbi:MAG: DUF4232 domain-containing protein [Trebonia sp.]